MAFVTKKRTCSIDNFISATARGFTWTRTDGCPAPLMNIRATPSICDSFWEIIVSAKA